MNKLEKIYCDLQEIMTDSYEITDAYYKIDEVTKELGQYIKDFSKINKELFENTKLNVSDIDETDIFTAIDQQIKIYEDRLEKIPWYYNTEPCYLRGKIEVLKELKEILQ